MLQAPNSLLGPRVDFFCRHRLAGLIYHRELGCTADELEQRFRSIVDYEFAAASCFATNSFNRDSQELRRDESSGNTSSASRLNLIAGFQSPFVA